ncbi:MAG: phosphate ABC transporter permease subunit PstC [bacterium]
MENNVENKTNKYLTHKPLKYGKKFYFGEFVAEKFIKMVALVSIVSILAIFYYVFQEATYAFKKPKIEKVQVESQNSTANDKGDLVQETYGSAPSKTEDTELKQETYGTSSSKNEEPLKQETYGSATVKEEPLKQETYGTASTKESTTEVEKAVSESESENEAVYNSEENDNALNPVNLRKLILANDYVDDKPAYVWQPISEVPKYSFIPLFIGALKVTLIGLLFAAPLAILAAIFTVAFAPKWLKEIIKPAIEVLAGFPSVVIGFFCLMTLASVIQSVFHTTYRLNSFVGGLGMAMAVIPIIYTITEDALSAVPQYMRAASLALGASRWQTAWKVLLPAAAPGVFAALILGFGRAFGETMIALMATGNAALVSGNIFESVRTMAATIGAEMAEVEFRGIHYGVLFLIGAVLFTVTFSLNALAEFYVRKKLMKKFQGQ